MGESSGVFYKLWCEMDNKNLKEMEARGHIRVPVEILKTIFEKGRAYIEIHPGNFKLITVDDLVFHKDDIENLITEWKNDNPA